MLYVLTVYCTTVLYIVMRSHEVRAKNSHAPATTTANPHHDLLCSIQNYCTYCTHCSCTLMRWNANIYNTVEYRPGHDLECPRP